MQKIFVQLRLLVAAVFAGVALGLLGSATASAAPSLHIGGAITAPGDWTAERLRKEFASELTPVTYATKGQSHTSTCIPLLSVLKAAGTPAALKMDPGADPKTKNLALRLVVVVTASDGYTIALSLPELLPAFGNAKAWLALDIDGQPLDGASAPARLIVPGDSKPGRWIHGIASIAVVDLSNVGK